MDIISNGDGLSRCDHRVLTVGRTAEAVQRLRALLVSSRGIDDAIVATAHVRLGRILFDTGRLDEARAEWPALAARARRFGAEVAELASFAAAKCGHPRSAALLLGHARAFHARRGSSENSLPIGDIARTTAMTLDSLDRETLEELILRGRELTETEADALLLAAQDG